MSYGYKTNDSILSAWVFRLDQLDPTLNLPLKTVTWGRDIDTIEASLAYESTSFIRASYAAMGTSGTTGLPWISPTTSVLSSISVDGEKVMTPLRALGHTLSYTSQELEKSNNLTIPGVEMQKYSALQEMYQMYTDQMVYIGDPSINATGLLNDAHVSVGAASKTFATATPDEIVEMYNEAERTCKENAGEAVTPSNVLLPPTQFAMLVARKVSDTANLSILEYIKKNSLCLAENGVEPEIHSCKWLTGRGVGGANRMVFYTKNARFVRFPMVPIRREQAYYFGITYNAPYIWGYGQVEFPYLETVLYRDGI